MGELDSTESLPNLPRFVFAMSGQWNVRAPGVLAGERPPGFAVTNEVKAQSMRK